MALLDFTHCQVKRCDSPRRNQLNFYDPFAPLRAVIAGNDCGNGQSRAAHHVSSGLPTNGIGGWVVSDQWRAGMLSPLLPPMHPGHRLTLLQDEGDWDDPSHHCGEVAEMKMINTKEENGIYSKFKKIHLHQNRILL